MFRNRVTTYNEYGEPVHTSIYFKSWGKRLTDQAGDGVEVDLDSGAGLRVLTGVRILVRYDSRYKLGNDEIRTFITVEGQEAELKDIEIQDRRRWLILVVSASS